MVLGNIVKNIGFSSVTEFISTYYSMVDSCIDEISCWHGFAPERRDRLVGKVQKARSFLYFSMNNDWKTLRSKLLTDGLLDILELVDDAIVATGSISTFDEDKMHEYASQLQEISDGIVRSELPEEVKAPILGHLLRLIRIFETFDVSGLMDAELRIKAILGDIVINSEAVNSSSEEARASLIPLMAFIQKHYPGFKWTVDHLITVSNAGLLAVQSGVL